MRRRGLWHRSCDGSHYSAFAWIENLGRNRWNVITPAGESVPRYFRTLRDAKRYAERALR